MLPALIFLAVLQGVAEFLPISSSGHVVIAAHLLPPETLQKLDVGEVNIVLHLGTLLSILCFYWRRWLELLRGPKRVIVLLIVGTLPGALLGVAAKLFLKDALESLPVAGALLIVTGLLLLWMGGKTHGEKEYSDLTPSSALWIGLSQAAAIFPGLSRSGATISAGMALGLSPRAAADFSFLLAVPIIAGAGGYELLSWWKEPAGGGSEVPVGYLLLAMGVAFVVGLASLRWLLKWLQQGRLHWFAWWCLPLGVTVLAWWAVRG